MAGNDDPTNPAHYHMPIEPRDFIMANGLGYCEGNVIKYVCRWRMKNGVIDLRKARNYIDRLILEAEKETPMAERKRPPFTYTVKRDSLKWGCAPLVLLAVLLAVAMSGCVSRSVVRLNETTADGGTFRIVYRNIGDARSEQQVDYQADEWRLRVGSASDVISPAHEAAAAQLTALAASLGELLGKIPW